MTKKTQKILRILANHNGQNIRASWVKPVKTLKGFTGKIHKFTSAIVRAGINFANLESVQSSIAKGERAQVQPLSWGIWLKFPLIIGHKEKEYLRLYPCSMRVINPKVIWILNDHPISYSEIESVILASEKPSGEIPECFTVTIDYLVSLNNQRV